MSSVYICKEEEKSFLDLIIHGEGLKMDTKDAIKLGHRAKQETEEFINRYLSNNAKGWPKLYLCQSDCSNSQQESQTVKRSSY